MPLVHHAQREITLKIVYYGVGLGGKTTNLETIHAQTRPDARGQARVGQHRGRADALPRLPAARSSAGSAATPCGSISSRSRANRPGLDAPDGASQRRRRGARRRQPADAIEGNNYAFATSTTTCGNTASIRIESRWSFSTTSATSRACSTSKSWRASRRSRRRARARRFGARGLGRLRDREVDRARLHASARRPELCDAKAASSACSMSRATASTRAARSR